MTSPVTIGLQQSFYSTVEGQGPVDVCMEVLSGDITGSSFTISYSTSDGLAEGKHSLQSSLHTFYINTLPYTQLLLITQLRVDHS